MPKELASGKPTTRRYSSEEKAAVGIAVMAVRISGCDGLVGLTDESGVWYWLKQQRSPSSASSARPPCKPYNGAE